MWGKNISFIFSILYFVIILMTIFCQKAELLIRTDPDLVLELLGSKKKSNQIYSLSIYQNYDQVNVYLNYFSSFKNFYHEILRENM